ncbi:MAG: hypothetical protein Q9M31_03865 [Mariprofundus sp.]|nr:hypothetical protein [Mariprofundus sp.]
MLNIADYFPEDHKYFGILHFPVYTLRLFLRRKRLRQIVDSLTPTLSRREREQEPQLSIHCDVSNTLSLRERAWVRGSIKNALDSSGLRKMKIYISVAR